MPTSVNSLSSSLLARVKGHDPAAWERLVAIYSPVVYGWCRSARLNPDEAMDVVQDVFRAVLIAVGQFRGDREGDTFHGWLRTITRNKVRDYFRAAARRPTAVGGTDAQRRLTNITSEQSLADEEDESAVTGGIVARALEAVKLEFEPNTWAACWRTTVDGEGASDVAAALGMTVGAVYKAKSRVLARLRVELEGLTEL
jgi:RNA polymerase sigma-70 factor (ECF subfamily)